MRYILIDAVGDPVKPVLKYLKYKDNTGSARNTLRAYCYHLKLFFEFLEQEQVDYRDVGLDEMAAFMGWLKKVSPISPTSSSRAARSINIIISAVISFYDYLNADEAISGKTDQRAEFLQMIQDAKIGLFDIVIVHKLDRFARNRYDSAIYKKQLKSYGVTVYSILEKLDNSPESILLEALYEGLAEYYSANLAREVHTKSLVHAQKAQHMGGIPPLGYNLTTEKNYEINQIEAESVRLIFDLYCKGYGYGTIADQLNGKGYKTKVGNPFSKNGITDILINEKYIGRFVYNKRLSKKSGNRKYKSDDEIIRIDNAFPQIIELSQWQQVQNRLKQNQKGPRMTATHLYILSGVMECGECGCAYIGGSWYLTRSREKIYQYTCSSRDRQTGCKNKNIRADVIEKYVIDRIKDDILSDAAITKLLSENDDIIKSQTDKSATERKKLLKKQKETQNKINKTFELYYVDGIDKEILAKKMSELKDQLTVLEDRIQQNRASNITVSQFENIKNMLLSFRTSFDETDPTILKTAIEAFVKKVIVYQDDIQVILKINIPPTSPTNGGNVRGKVGGGEGSRTPVRKPVHRTFYKLSKRDLFSCMPSLLQNYMQVASFSPHSRKALAV